MHPTMLIEMANSSHREQIANHKKLVRTRRHEIHDHVWTEESGSQPSADLPLRALIAKIAGWLGRMRPARVG